MEINITKRDGRLVPFDADKVNDTLEWACEGLKDVSPSEVAMNAHIQFYDKMPSEQVQDLLINSAANLIKVENPDYQYVAGRLLMFDLRKKAFGTFDVPEFYEHITGLVKLGKYDAEILEKYSLVEIDYLEQSLDHERDMDYTYAAMMEWKYKYLVKDKTNNQYFESPQQAIMLISMCLHQDEKVNRLDKVIAFYDAVSLRKISLPTPIMGGVRTPTRQFSSCFPAGQQVMTSEGLKVIEDVLEGDLVLTNSGTYQEVLFNGSKVSDVENLVELRTQLTIPWNFCGTEDHEVLALKKNNEASRKNYDVENWVKLSQLEVGDFVKIPFNKHTLNSDNLRVVVPEGYSEVDGMIYKKTTDSRQRCGETDDKVKPVPSQLPITEKLMVVFGYYLAEGHINGSQLCFTFASVEQDYIQEVSDYFKTLGLDAKISVRNDNSTTVSVFSQTICDTFEFYLGKRFDQKKLNEKILRIKPEMQKHLLSGVIRGDGCVHKNGMVLGLNNQTLIQQLAMVCLRLGFYPSLGVSENNSGYGTGTKNYKLNLGNQKVHHDFLENVVKKSLDKLAKASTTAYGLAKYKDGEYYAKVLEIRSKAYNKETVYDLSVDNDHSFTVSGICVHNCTLIEAGDSLDEINSASNAIVKYVSQRAGIGINAGMIRSLGSPIRGGEAFHTGCIPFYKHFQTAVKSCSQGGLRSGAATLFYPWWHEEVESLIVLKNNKGTEDNRVRHMDYGVQMNRLIYERFLSKQKVSLFSPNVHPDLYDKFFKPNDEFKELYEQLEANPLIKRKEINAVDLVSLIANERSATGRIYIQNVDHCNSNSPFDWDVAPIKQSNLC